MAKNVFFNLEEHPSGYFFVLNFKSSLDATVTSVFLVLVYSVQAVPVVTSVREAPVQAPARTSPSKKVPWTASREAASLWSGDIDGKMFDLSV